MAAIGFGDDGARALADAHLAAVLQEAVADLGGPLRTGVHQHHVGDVDGVLFADDLLAAGTLLVSHFLELEVGTLNCHLVQFVVHRHDLAAGVLVPPTDHLHCVPLEHVPPRQGLRVGLVGPGKHARWRGKQGGVERVVLQSSGDHN